MIYPIYSMVKKVYVKNKPIDFVNWLNRLKLAGFAYEIVIEDYFVERVYVKEPDNGDWKDVAHGRVTGSSGMSYKQKTYRPRIVDGKFIYNYND